jgi:hypothetical protein
MKVTLTSLNPPKVREVNPYGKYKPHYQPKTAQAVFQFVVDEKNWQEAESSLKEWELSENSFEDLRVIWSRDPEWKDWAIGQTLNVEIVEGKAVIV